MHSIPPAESSSRAFFERLLELLYPGKCPLCGLLSPEAPCQTCRAEMKPSEPRVIFEREGPLDFRASLYRYEGRAGQAVRRLKYARSTSLAAWMASEISRGVGAIGCESHVVVPVPIHWTRHCYRGFNQADLLCTATPRESTYLVRHRATRPQVGLSREQRLQNLAGAFRASPAVSGMSVLLIDDVVTSGQTARECARALLEKGAREVGVLAFCGETDWLG